MRFENSKKLYTYWLNLKGSRNAPERTEIEPSDIRTLLGDTFILEVNHQKKYVIYRLAGSRLCSAYARELKGLGFLVHWQEDDNLDILRTVTNVYSGYFPGVISHLGETEQKRFVEYETLLLPLQPNKDGTTRILGISSPKKVPFWLGAEPIVSHRVRSIRQVAGKSGQFSELEPILSPPLQHDYPDQNPLKDISAKRKISHLKLLDGGKS